MAVLLISRFASKHVIWELPNGVYSACWYEEVDDTGLLSYIVLIVLQVHSVALYTITHKEVHSSFCASPDILIKTDYD